VNKIWNAARFILMNTPSAEEGNGNMPAAGVTKLSDLATLGDEQRPLGLADSWMLSRLARLVIDVTEDLEEYKFYEACDVIYQFVWHEYCDWYLELAKLDLYQDDDPQLKERCTKILCGSLEVILRLLHPIMPFITEELWQHLPRSDDSPISIALCDWPEPDKSLVSEDAERSMSLVMEIITKVRTMRSEMNVPPSRQAPVIVYTANASLRELLRDGSKYIMSLARTESLTVTDSEPERKHCATAVGADCEIFVPLEGIINFELERARLGKELKKIDKNINADELKLRNREFISNAPRDIIEMVKKRHRESTEQRAKIERALKFVAD